LRIGFLPLKEERTPSTPPCNHARTSSPSGPDAELVFVWRKRGQRVGRKVEILNPAQLWKELKRIPLRQIAAKHGVTRRTISFKLRRISEKKYEKIIAKRRINSAQRQMVVSELTWMKLEDGYSVRQIAKEQGVHPSILHERMQPSRRYDGSRSKLKETKIHVMREAAKRFKQGETLARLSNECKIDQTTLRQEFQGTIGQKKYERIIEERRRNPRNKIPTGIIEVAATRLKQGTKLIELTRDLKIHRKTLRRRLREELGDRYGRIMQRRRIPDKLFQRSSQKFIEGYSLSRLSKEYEIPLSTLHRRLPKIIGEKKYRDIIRKRQLHIIFGTTIKGAISKYELKVKELLNRNKIRFSTTTIIETNGHRYFPDFVICRSKTPLVIEATGMDIERYWMKYKRKLEDYEAAGYKALFVASDTSVYKMALKYVHEDVLVKFNEFVDKVASLKKVPDKRDCSRPMANRTPKDTADIPPVISQIACFKEIGNQLILLLVEFQLA